MTVSQQASQQQSMQLNVTCPNGTSRTHILSAESSVIVGSGDSCGLRLEHASVDSMHCLFNFMDGELWLQPWNSEAPLAVAGQAVSEATLIQPGQEVAVGAFRVKPWGLGGAQPMTRSEPEPELAAAEAPAAQPLAAEEKDERPQPPPESHDPEEAAARWLKHDGDDEEPATEPEPLDAELQSIYDEPDSQTQPETEPQPTSVSLHLDPLDADDEEPVMEWGEPGDVAEQSLPEYETELYEETIALLRAEVEQLQSDLAERDEQLAELTPLLEGAPAQPAGPADDDMSGDMVSIDRLEQALLELEKCDTRISELERLLQLAEEAKQAEKEEREQIETWVSDIETRAGQLEAEWRAETEMARNDLAAAKAENERLSQQLQKAARQAGSRVHAEELEHLRQKNLELQSAIDEVKATRDQLKQQLEKTAAEASTSDQTKLDEGIRAEQLKLAQERAALARERAELEKKQYAQQDSGTKSEIDDRIHAFREHLKTIDSGGEGGGEDEERSLGSRLSRLWKRLEGRG